MASKSFLARFLTMFGDLKIFGWPMFLLYDPGSFKVKGDETRALMDMIEPGDILVRGYHNYLDGHFIPGYFSHVGLYVGEVVEGDRESVNAAARGLKDKESAIFHTGKQMVIHALAEGVLLEDLISFSRCDYLAVLRFPSTLRLRAKDWKPLAPLSPREQKIHDDLHEGVRVNFSDVFGCIKDAALGKLGTDYDFDFNFNRFDYLSCSELVYFATKCVGAFLNVDVEDRRVLMFLRRSLIQPDAFASAPLDVVWRSRSLDVQKLKALNPAFDRPPPVAQLAAPTGVSSRATPSPSQYASQSAPSANSAAPRSP